MRHMLYHLPNINMCQKCFVFDLILKGRKFCSLGKAISVTTISIDAANFRNVTCTCETGLHYSSFFVVMGYCLI